MDANLQDIVINIEQHESKNDKSNKTMMYDVKIQTPKKSYSIVKTFKDFKVLLYQLKKTYHSLNDVKLPIKRFFSVKTDNEITCERKVALNQLIKQILELEKISNNDVFLSFFQLHLSSEESAVAESNQNIFSAQDNEFDDFIPACDDKIPAQKSDFRTIKPIGKGTFGRVFLVQHIETGKYYAMKVLEKKMIQDRNENHHVMAERAVLMKTATHPFLIGLHYSFQTPDKLYFILDYANGGELFFHLQNKGSFVEDHVKFYTAAIGDAIGFLHSKNIIYRDLKPENILLDSHGYPKLTDFGLSREIMPDKQKFTTICGTPEYMAPETIMNLPYDESVDWWALGCVTFELLDGIPPFFAGNNNLPEMYKNICNKEVTFRVKCSLCAKGFIQALLKKNPTERLGYGPGDWNDIKQHPFLRNISWDDLYNRKLKPPFDPSVESELDFKNIDEMFLADKITDSIINDGSNPLSDKPPSNQFIGFTYVQDKELD